MSSRVFSGFAILLLITLLPVTLERGILGLAGVLVGVWLGWPRIEAKSRPWLVVGVLIAGAIGAAALPLVMNDTLPRLFRREFAGAAISLIAPFTVWLLASALKNRMSE